MCAWGFLTWWTLCAISSADAAVGELETEIEIRARTVTEEISFIRTASFDT
jgi:hypothetical protein